MMVILILMNYNCNAKYNVTHNTARKVLKPINEIRHQRRKTNVEYNSMINRKRNNKRRVGQRGRNNVKLHVIKHTILMNNIRQCIKCARIHEIKSATWTVWVSSSSATQTMKSPIHWQRTSNNTPTDITTNANIVNATAYNYRHEWIRMVMKLWHAKIMMEQRSSSWNRYISILNNKQAIQSRMNSKTHQRWNERWMHGDNYTNPATYKRNAQLTNTECYKIVRYICGEAKTLKHTAF